jgi:hypothetical protein
MKIMKLDARRFLRLVIGVIRIKLGVYREGADRLKVKGWPVKPEIVKH